MRGRACAQNYRKIRMGLGIVRGDQRRFAPQKNARRYQNRARKMVTERRVGRNQPLTRWFWTVILHAVAAEMFRVRRRGFVSKRVSRRHADEEEQSGLIIIITSMCHVYIRIYSLKANAVLFFLSRDHHAILVCLSRFLSLSRES